MLYQALLGVLPGEVDAEELGNLQERFSAYALKAVREAKTRTDWAKADEDYEAAVERYVAALLSPENRDFLDDFIATAQPYIASGYLNSLAQTLIKIAAPGIPDFYQGTEGIDLSLVDPDNRRPVDYGKFAVSERPEAQVLKQKLITTGLRLRHQRQSLFLKGDYRPLKVEGALAEHVVAFMRVKDNDFVIVLTPRLMFSALQPQTLVASPGFWGDTRIIMPEARCRRKKDLMSGLEFAAGDLLVSDILVQPVALLVGA